MFFSSLYINEVTQFTIKKTGSPASKTSHIQSVTDDVELCV